MRISSTTALRTMCITLVGIGVALRFWFALTDSGIYAPDEIFQSLEPAHRAIFGYGFISPEFYLGARNWAFPGLSLIVLRVCSWLTGDEPHHYMPAVHAIFAFFSTLAIVGTYRLARVIGASNTGAALSAILLALAPPAIYFAPRALSDTTSASVLVWGFALSLDTSATRRRFVIGVSLVGLAVLFRMQNGMFALGLIAVLVQRRSYRDARLALFILAVWAFAYGAIDRITWGGWFHSAVAYMQLAEKASLWGVSPFTYYFHIFWTSMPWITLFAVPLALVTPAPGLLAIVLLDLVALSLVGHKEFRYVFPLVPLWFALAGLGYSVIAARLTLREWAVIPFAVLALVSGLRFRELTFQELGFYEDQPPQNALDGFGDVNRLLFAAHDREDLCGIKLEAARLAWSGGATYLHRRVPIYGRDETASAGHFNYVITVGNITGGEVVARDGHTALIRMASSCTPDPRYNWALR